MCCVYVCVVWGMPLNSKLIVSITPLV